MSPPTPEVKPSSPAARSQRKAEAWAALSLELPGQLCQSLSFTKDERSECYAAVFREGGAHPACPCDPAVPSRGLRCATAPLRAQFCQCNVSVLQVGVTLMLYPVSKLETVCPLGSEYPCGGLAPWAGLERAEGHGLGARGLASVPPLQQKMDSTVPASDPAGRPALSRLAGWPGEL